MEDGPSLLDRVRQSRSVRVNPSVPPVPSETIIYSQLFSNFNALPYWKVPEGRKENQLRGGVSRSLDPPFSMRWG